MFHEKVLVTLMMFAAVGSAPGLLASTASGARHAQRTIALVRDANGFFDPVQEGAESASTALGDRLSVETADDAATQISTIKSLIAQHVDAIAVDALDH